MFKKNLVSSKGFLLTLSLIILSFVFTACNKNDDNIQQPDAAGIMGFNLAADQNATGFRIDGRIFTQNPLAFGNYTANYRAVYTGSRRLESFNYNSGALLDSARTTFQNDKYYSTFLFGRNNNYDQVIVEDALDTLAYQTNKAYVRMVNAYTLNNFIPTIVYLQNNAELSNNRLAYKAITEFMQIPAGEIKVEARAGSEPKTSRTINFEANKVYTLLLLDNANMDTLANPEIKFIVNGIIEP